MATTTKKPTKLKNLFLKSVDLVRAGANQEADIRIFKSDNLPETEDELTETIEKDFTTFNSAKMNLENHEKLWQYQDALRSSIRSIVEDRELTQNERLEYFRQSLNEFDEAMMDLFDILCIENPTDTKIEVPQLVKSDRYDEIEEVTKADHIDHIVEIEKFNINHDPKTGRFCSGTTSGGVSNRTISNGGISVHIKTGKEPKKGYMVAVYGERSQWLKGDEVTDTEKRESAIKFASEHNEKAIWDVENMSEIPTGGTGNNL